MNILTKYPVKSRDAASRIIDNQAVIVIPQEGLVRVLNHTGTKIWSLLDGKNNIKYIVKKLLGEFEISLAEARKDVLVFLNELEDKQMVVFKDEPVM